MDRLDSTLHKYVDFLYWPTKNLPHPTTSQQHHSTLPTPNHATTTNMAEQAVENNIGLGLFGDDDEEDADHQQLQQQQYQDDLDADDILGLDDDAEVIENPEGSLLMRFCPHDSSMLYPKVSFISMWMLPLP